MIGEKIQDNPYAVVKHYSDGMIEVIPSVDYNKTQHRFYFGGTSPDELQEDMMEIFGD